MICSESIQALIDAFNDPIVKYAIWLSIETAFYATCIALVLGIPLAYLLARKDFFGKAFIKSIVDLPVVIPHTVAGIALLTVFGAHGIIGAPLENASIKFVDAMPGIVVAMLFVSIPFVINSAQDGFEAVDRRLENVARNLGASRLKTFTTITLPLASRNIFTGSIMAWARAVSEFGAVIILVYYLKVAPTLIYDKFIEGGLYASRPVAILLILVCLTVFIVLRFVTTYKIPLKKRSYKRFGR
jgi:molybdate/tungstate transport system permease protein